MILNVKGPEVYRCLGYEGGGHRVQRVPETEAQGRIHTSAATVAVLPEPQEVNIKINWEADVVSTERLRAWVAPFIGERQAKARRKTAVLEPDVRETQPTQSSPAPESMVTDPSAPTDPDPEQAAVRLEALRECARLEAEMARLRAAAGKEKQMARKVELNMELKRIEAAHASALEKL